MSSARLSFPEGQDAAGSNAKEIFDHGVAWGRFCCNNYPSSTINPARRWKQGGKPKMNTNIIGKYLWLIILILSPSMAMGESPIRLVEQWRVSGALAKPESVVFDTARSVLYVSNINGKGDAKDGNGYLTKISLEGKILDKRWVAGLNGPKGMALIGDKLYVADIDVLVKIDVDSGKILSTYPGKGAVFLNDVAIDAAGNVFVSDSRGSTLFKLHGDSFDVWLKDSRLQNPNGLYAAKNDLIVAASDADAENPGASLYLQKVSFDAKKISPLDGRRSIGGIDGIAADGGDGFFLTDWGAGKVMHTTAPSKGVTTLKQLDKGTADLCVDTEKQMMFLPVMLSHQLIAYRIERSE
jgi:sugar lactone lactonase YvrE